MSKLEKLPQKNLKFILKRMNEGIELFGDRRQLISSSTQRIVKDIFNDIGMNINDKDMEFVFALYRDNPNYLTEEIKIPELHEYEVITKRYATINVRELWKNTYESYFNDEDDVDDFQSWFGGADWWDGEMIDREDYDEETDETEIDEINKLS
jgi:predicted transcriptional regulator YdeE